MLTIRQGLPDGLLNLQSHELYTKLDGPTLFQIPGRRTPPIFISVLLHGNEPVGWNAIREILYRYQNKTLPRALSLFVGNIEAARYHQRHLENQPDFNRIWPSPAGNIHTDECIPEQGMAYRVYETMAETGLFASVDVHNNTGLNPHYACVNRLEAPFLHLAALFDRTVIYFTRPKGVLSLTFSELAPSVTLECGQPNCARGEAHAIEYLNACLNLTEIPAHALTRRDIELFHTVAIVRIKPGISVGFQDNELDLQLIDNIDHLNFNELPLNTLIGWQRNSSSIVLRTIDEQDQDVSERYFHLDGQALRVRRPVMPSMLTRNVQVIHQDCLCYLMERLTLPDSATGIIEPATGYIES